MIDTFGYVEISMEVEKKTNIHLSQLLKWVNMFLSKIKFITKEIQYGIPNPHRLIHDHYALILQKDKALIFTRSPLRNPKSHFISHETIKGKSENQYLSGYVYKIEPNIMLLEPVENGQDYISKNFLAISKAQKAIDLDSCIELSKYLPWLGGGNF